MKLVENYSSEEEDKEEQQSQRTKTEEPSFEEFVASKFNTKLSGNLHIAKKRRHIENSKAVPESINHLAKVPEPPEALFNKFSKRPCTGLTQENKKLDSFVYNRDLMNFIRQARSIELYFYMDFILESKVRQSLETLTKYFNAAFEKHNMLLTENKLDFYRKRMSNNIKNSKFSNDSWFYKMYHSDFMQKNNSYRIGNPELFMRKDVHAALRTYNKTLKSFVKRDYTNGISTLGIQFCDDQEKINPLFINKYGLEESLHVSMSTGASSEDISAKTHSKEIDVCQNSLKKDIAQLRQCIEKGTLDTVPEKLKQKALNGDWKIKLEPQIVMYPNMYFTKIYFAFKVLEECYDLFHGIRGVINRQSLFEKTALFISLDNLHVSTWVLDLPFPRLDMNAVYSESLYEIVQDINSQLEDLQGITCEVNNFKLKRETGDIQTFFFR